MAVPATQPSFSRIALRCGSPEASFEEFCCQLAHRAENIPAGSNFARLRGAGGDGGVECFWTLPSGEEWGWQAKYVFEVPRLIAQLRDSIETALQIHPRLTRYFIGIPFNPTGPTGRQGTSELERLSGFLDEQRQAAEAQGREVEFILQPESVLLDELLRIDTHGARTYFWFDQNVLSDQWFSNHLQDMRVSAGPRYSTPIVESSLDGAFQALRGLETGADSITTPLRRLRELVTRMQRRVESEGPSGDGPAYPDDLRGTGGELCRLATEACEAVEALMAADSTHADMERAREATAAALPLARECHVSLRQAFEQEHGEGSADSPGVRQWHAEYMCTFPAMHLDNAKDCMDCLDELERWTTSPFVSLRFTKGMILLGDAGVGKTHSICDAAVAGAEQGLRTIVVFGHRFAASDPWVQIRDLLGLDPELDRDGLLGLFNSAGQTSGAPLLFCIDALNETRDRAFWHGRLNTLIAQAGRFPNVRLCLSCRSTYLERVVPDDCPLVRVEHPGFRGMEVEATRAFFEHYEMEPVLTPDLQAEFSNPLFLHLVCKALRANGLTRLPDGWAGIYTAIAALLMAASERYALQTGTRSSARTPERGVEAFVQACLEHSSSTLEWDIAQQTVDDVQPTGQHVVSLLEWLVDEGILYVDAATSPTTGDQDVVRVAFERLGDHLIARNYIQGTSADDLCAALSDSGRLGWMFASTDSVDSHAGVIEALSIQIPEEYGVELADLLPADAVADRVARVSVLALPWRTPGSVGRETAALVQRCLRQPEWSGILDVVLLSSTRTGSEVNADWLHGELEGVPSAARDGYWGPYLHQTFGTGGAVDRLMDTVWKIDTSRLEASTAMAWATPLCWFLAASDRRVRDNATKCLVALTETCPGVWGELIERFAEVGDDYITERCLVSAYGALLRAQDGEAARSVARVACDSVLAHSSRFLNASIRDHARAIIEYSEHMACVPDGIEPADYLPPYDSAWPIMIPSEDEVSRYRDTYDEYPKLYRSCFDDDFFHYQLGSLTSYEGFEDKNAVARWIFMHVLAMGYDPDVHRDFDRYILGRFGPGRGKPSWAERIGKKYQWIARDRLAGVLSDHVQERDDSFEPERSRVDYTGYRFIDPSLLMRASAKQRRTRAWWISAGYDFSSCENLAANEWAALMDVPRAEDLLPVVRDPEGSEWVVLHAYPEWSDRPADADWNSPYRQIWMHIRSYLVPRTHFDECWDFVEQRSFMGQWMPTGPEYYEGYVGEYPWGVKYNLYPEWYVSRGRNDVLPHDVIPTEASLTAHFEYDAYQTDTINAHAPAKVFFEHAALKWNTRFGYVDEGGQLIAHDPSIEESGPGALLMRPGFLDRFLAENDLALIWTVLWEKTAKLSGAIDQFEQQDASQAAALVDGVFRTTAAHMRDRDRPEPL